MVPIAIDLSEIAQEFELDKTAVTQLIKMSLSSLASEYAYLWDQYAKVGLRGTRQQYRRALQVGEDNDGMVTYVALTGTLPVMLELGVPPFDMKTGFAKSSKVKMKNGGGWYLTIPFRHSTPGAIGENELFNSKPMPSAVYNVAKKLQGTFTGADKRGHAGWMQSIGESLKDSQLPPELQTPRVRAKIKGPDRTWNEYEHKSSIWKGMIRQRKTYEKATQSQYVTFRRVSDTSDELSWIHKGLDPRLFHQKALDKLDVETELAKSIDSFLEHHLNK